MEMTREGILRDRAIIAAASPADERWGGIYGDGPAGVLRSTGPEVASVDQAEMDTVFIRTARNRWAAALDEIDRLRGVK